MLKDVLFRVEQRLEAVGLSAAAASRNAGLSEDAIRNMQRAAKKDSGRKGVSTATITALADVLDTTVGWLMGDEVDAEIETEIRVAPPAMVKIVGRVGAGARVEAIEDMSQEPIALPGELEDASAYWVEGDSCSPVFEPGDVLVVRGPGRADEGEFLNRYCVVETDDGLGWVKRVTRGMTVPGRGRLYNLESDNADPIQNQQIKSARPVLLRLIQGGR